MKALLFLAAVALLISGPCPWADPPPSGAGTSTNQNEGLEEGDPIAMNSGSFFFEMPLLDLGGPLPLSYSINYRQDQYSSNEHFRWFQGSTSFFLELMYFEGRYVAEVHLRNGETPQFTLDEGSGQWTLDAASSIRYVLKETGPDHQHGWYYLMDPARGRLIIFEKVTDRCGEFFCLNRPRFVIDGNGNRHTYSYSDSGSGPDFAPVAIADGLGRTLTFTFSGDDHVARITDQSGRFVEFNYDPNAPDYGNGTVLRSVTGAAGGVTTFRYIYSPGGIISIEHPLGNTPYTQQIGWMTLNGKPYRRVTSQTDAYGNTCNFGYAADATEVTATDPEGGTTTFGHLHNDGPPTEFTDAEGDSITGTATANQQVASFTDRLGATTATTYHPESGKLASYTNAEGHTTSLTYAAREQSFTNPATRESVTFTLYDLARIDYADGTHEGYTRDASGNMMAYRNRAGAAWAYTYNERGQALTITNPEGGVITYTYNADGTLASSSDSDLGITTYAYDAQKRMTALTRPGGDTVHYAYDADGRPVTVTDERGKATAYAYDANGNLDSTTDPLGHARNYSQDLMDRVTGETDPLGHAEAYAYDTRGRLASFTDRNGNANTYAYDARGRLAVVTDPAGKAWVTGYDAEGVPSSFTTPLGFVTRYETDAVGRRTAVTDPLGGKVRYSYDELGHPATVTDEGGQEMRFTYDGGGLLAGASVGGLVSASYTHSALGGLTRVTDPTGHAWDFDYSSMGRRISHTDPLGRTCSFAYDARGRVAKTNWPDGGTADYIYDAASHVGRIKYSAGPTLDFTYDDAGRLSTANGLQLSYDERGDMVGCWNGGALFGATYDAGARLKTVTYGGEMTVAYTYDSRNLLTRAEDNLSGTWMAFAYDEDRRLISVQRSNGVSTLYTYDGANRLTRIRDGEFIDLSYTLNARGDITGIDCAAPLDPSEALSTSQAQFTYDVASQVSSGGYSYNARGQRTGAQGAAYSWDGAGRLTGASGASLVYNGLGDLAVRNEGGGGTRYYYNHAVGLHPIVAEKDEAAGHFRRFYVWSPGGRLLYAVDAEGNHAPLFYHFDHLGTTLALTDATGSVTDAYAYDPHGRLLAHEGESTQPFTFVGQMGVRQEGAGGRLYHMRARYYDADTAAFLSRDPVWPDLRNPLSLNPYQYANGNPVSLADPTGLNIVEKAKALYGKIKGIMEKSGASTAADAKELLDSVKSLREAAEKLKKQMENAGNVEGLDNALNQVKDVIGSLDEIAGAIEGAALSGQSLVNALNGMKFIGSLQGLQGALGGLGKALGAIGDVAGKLGPALAVAQGLADFAIASNWAYTWATEGSGAAAAQMQGQATYQIATILTDDGSPDDAAKTEHIMHEQSQNPVFQAVSWVIDLFW